jgi:photosystem II stability/assembly factor-like uncharacterized protein
MSSKNQITRERKMNKTIRMKNVISSLIIIALFLGFIPVTSYAGSWNGWIYQDPYPTSNNLQSVKFVTPKKGWIAGEQGTILYTEDGGDTWEYQESGTEKEIRILFFINERQGWAVGGQGDSPVKEKGMILHTEDGGKSWVEQQGEFDTTLNSVFFLNDKEGWIAGNEGVLLHTTDGGKKWERQKNVGVTHAIANVYFLNAQTGWLLAGDEIYRTTDGGKNWDMATVEIVPPRQERIVPGRLGGVPILRQDRSVGALYFANEKRGWAVVGREFIFMTEDGGKTWTDQLKTGRMSYGLGSIAFIDDKRGCAVGTSIICTEDGGATWKERLGIRPRGREMIDGFNIALMGIAMVNQSSGWAVGVEGQIMKTVDNGKTWKMAAKRNECGGNAFFINKKTGWLHGRYSPDGYSLPYVCRTDDGGLTWEKRDVGFGVFGIYFLDGSTGWAVGERKEGIVKPPCPCPGKVWATIKQTTDGGRTWKTSYEELISENLGALGLENVFFVDRNTGWAVGNDGLILNTVDGGKHWARQKSGYKKSQLWKIQFVDSKTGWIAGTDVNETWTGIILHTEDGGRHWKTQNKLEGIGLDGLFFASNKSGWVSGQIEWGGASWTLHTTDRGKTWSKVGFPSVGAVGNVAFLDENRGIYSTVQGWFSITTDGGKTWRKIKKPVRKFAWHFSEVFENVKSNK